MNSAVIYYFFTVVILSLSSLLGVTKELKTVIIFSTLFFIFGGSNFNGADWINYTNIYESLNESSWSDVLLNPPLEVLFSLVAKFFSSNGIDYQLFVAAISVFNLYLLIYMARKVCVKNIFLLFLVIFFIQGWSLFQEQIRQSIAVVICLFSVYKYFKSDVKTAYVLILIAIGFHISAVFGFLYLYAAGKIFKDNGQPLSMRSFVLITCFSVLAISALIFSVKTVSFESILPALWWQKLDYYINDEISSSSLLNFGLLAYLLGFFILLERRSYVIACKNNWLSFAWSMAVMWCVIGPFLRMIAIFTRFEHFLLILIPFALVSYELTSEKSFNESLLRKLLYIIFALTFTVRLFAQPAQSVWVEDYRNIFMMKLFNVEVEEREQRKDRVCNVLLDSGNDFCGLLN
ncbi:EpsG family protein [Polaromonas glacialis]|uniref:EpsG family protein n=1 Tax=Polaromonas glacialis TaxID=866564 RepID=UPI000A001AA1|nr:EpsG family protein [Polaromonas glacialis]